MRAIGGVDHVSARVNDARPLIDLFAGRLGLPVSWPLQESDFATFAWITLGNANLEIWAARSNTDLPAAQALPLFYDFALLPAGPLQQSLALLEQRGVQCKPPRPYITRDPDGNAVTNYTNSVVLDVSSDRCCVFFCEWGERGTIFPWKEHLSASQRRQAESARLRACGGGRLGITGLGEIRMASPSAAQMEEKWCAMTGQSKGRIRLGDDVQLACVDGDATRIERLTINVRSLALARHELAAMALLGEDTGSEISLLSSTCGGLQFHFRQAHTR